LEMDILRTFDSQLSAFYSELYFDSFSFFKCLRIIIQLEPN